MNPKTILILVAATAAIGALAYFVSSSNTPAKPDATKSADTADSTGTLLFPQAATKAGDVARVVIQQGEKKITFTRLDAPVKTSRTETSQWGINEKDNYPALEDKVRGLIRSVINASSIEAKTASPELYEKIGVDDPTKRPPAPADPLSVPKDQKKDPNYLVSLTDSSGANIASLIIGKKQDAANWDPEKATTYVRPADQAQSHLVRATYTLAMEPIDWMKRAPLDTAAGAFKSLRVQQPAKKDANGNDVPGEVVDIERPDAVIENYFVKQRPEGRALTDEMMHRSALIALSSLSADDVAKVNTIDFANAVVATYTTFDGAVYTVRSVPKDGKYWININVTSDPSLFTPTTPMPVPDGDAAKQEEAKQAAAKQDETRKAEVAKEVADLNARLSPWAYLVSDYSGKQFRVTLEQLLKPASTSPTQPTQVPVPSPMMPPG
ncbi:MAG: DUF4340 domain-containing protein [Phycisphaerales bacterium]